MDSNVRSKDVISNFDFAYCCFSTCLRFWEIIASEGQRVMTKFSFKKTILVHHPSVVKSFYVTKVKKNSVLTK